MKNIIFFILTLMSVESMAQMGYVKLKNDSVYVGLVKYYTSIEDGQWGIEVWKTYNDKKPDRYRKEELAEYAIKKDTFKIFDEFQPENNSGYYLEFVEALVKQRGALNLYYIDNYNNPNRVSNYTGGGLIPALIDESLGNTTFYFVLEDNASGNYSVLPGKKEELRDTLLDFFSAKYLDEYEKVHGAINLNKTVKLVAEYNSKHR